MNFAIAPGLERSPTISNIAPSMIAGGLRFHGACAGRRPWRQTHWRYRRCGRLRWPAPCRTHMLFPGPSFRRHHCLVAVVTDDGSSGKIGMAEVLFELGCSICVRPVGFVFVAAARAPVHVVLSHCRCSSSKSPARLATGQAERGSGCL